MAVGIDDIHFYSPASMIPLASLAGRYGCDSDKYAVGLGQINMAVAAVDEDIVTMAANAAWPLVADLDATEKSAIKTVLFATESGVDQSKAGGIFVHNLLGLPHDCRVVELKQACYGATAAVKLATVLVRANPREKVLVIASDIARYGLGTPGEVTQGCGAVAMMITDKPNLLEIYPASGCYTEDVSDFWRPNYLDTALVDGKYSTMVYLKALRQSWGHYQDQGGFSFDELSRFCYHLPFARMGEKAHRKLAVTCKTGLSENIFSQHIEAGLIYNRQLGNTYCASLYISLASLLDNDPEDLSGKNVGFFSYGSGCVSEFFAGSIQPGYRGRLRSQDHHVSIQRRETLTYEEYARRFEYPYPIDGGIHELPCMTQGRFRLAGFESHKRLYGPNPSFAKSLRSEPDLVAKHIMVSDDFSSAASEVRRSVERKTAAVL